MNNNYVNFCGNYFTKYQNFDFEIIFQNLTNTHNIKEIEKTLKKERKYLNNRKKIMKEIQNKHKNNENYTYEELTESIKKQENKIKGLRNKHKKILHTNKNTHKIEYIYKKYYVNSIRFKNEIKNKKGIISIIIKLIDSKGGHANLLVIDKNTDSYYYIEPHGKTLSLNNKFNKKKIIRILSNIFNHTIEGCTYKSQFQSKNPIDKGYCASWVWMIKDKLLNKPKNISVCEYLSKLNNNINNNSYNNFIREFIKTKGNELYKSYIHSRLYKSYIHSLSNNKYLKEKFKNGTINISNKTKLMKFYTNFRNIWMLYMIYKHLPNNNKKGTSFISFYISYNQSISNAYNEFIKLYKKLYKGSKFNTSISNNNLLDILEYFNLLKS